MTWMTLKFAGTCKVCQRAIAKGERGFYDRGTRKVTCSNMVCAKQDGLTEKQWVGSPVSGKFVDVLSKRRIGAPFQRNAPTGYENYEPENSY
jgi:hypothetical protein